MSECLGKIKQGMEKRDAERVCLVFFFPFLSRVCSAFCLVCVCVCVRVRERSEGKGTRGMILIESRMG